MKIIRIINKFFSFIFFVFKFRSLNIAFIFSHYQIPFNWTKTITRKDHNLVFCESKNQLPIPLLKIFRQGLPHLFKLLSDQRIKISSIQEHGFTAQYQNLSFNVLSVPNAATAKEVFVENIYDIFLPCKNLILLDIGFNVGYASLYFSKYPNITHIYGYEPFVDTVNEAKRNLLLNPAALEKINLQTIAISDYSGHIDVPMLESGSAVGSINEQIIQENAVNLRHTQAIKVEVEHIATVFSNLNTKHPDSNFFIKLDCEGEEYKVIQELSNLKLLGKIYCLVIEWHLLGPHKILNLLEQHNYSILHLPRHVDMGLKEATTGMIYAFRSSL